MKFCEECGAELADDAAFCEECGTPVDTAAEGLIQENPVQQAQSPVPSAETGQAEKMPSKQKKQSGNKTVVITGVIAVILVLCLGGAVIAYSMGMFGNSSKQEQAEEEEPGVEITAEPETDSSEESSYETDAEETYEDSSDGEGDWREEERNRFENLEPVIETVGMTENGFFAEWFPMEGPYIYEVEYYFYYVNSGETIDEYQEETEGSYDSDSGTLSWSLGWDDVPDADAEVGLMVRIRGRETLDGEEIYTKWSEYGDSQAYFDY